MSTFEKPVRTAGLAVLACLVFGCGMPANHPSTNVGHHVMAQQAIGADSQQAMPMADEQDPDKQIIDRLKITPEQLQKARTMLQQIRTPSEESIRQRAQGLKQLLTNTIIDVRKLAAYLQVDRDQIRNRLQDMVAVIAGIHDILSPEQREEIAKMEASPDVDETSDAAKDLQLNDQQQRVLETLRPTIADKDLRAAVHAFMHSGDREGLKTAIAAAIDKLPSADAIANALASLTPEQRQKLINLVAEPAQSSQK